MLNNNLSETTKKVAVFIENLQKNKFFGKIELLWREGKILKIDKSETFKVEELPR